MQQIAIQLPSIPLQLICVSTGQVGFSPMFASGSYTLVEYLSTGELLVIDDSGIKIGETEYKFNTGIYYKKETPMLKWLQSLNMQMPVFSNNPFGF